MKEQAEKLQRVEKSLSESKGPFELFALFLREDSPDKWDLLISADWARANKKKSIKTIIDEIGKVLTEQEIIMLSRIIILDKDDTALKAIQQVMRVEHGFFEIPNGYFFGLTIKHAYLITSQRTAKNKANSAGAKSRAAD